MPLLASVLAQTPAPLAPHAAAFNDYYQNPNYRPVIQGRILNLPDFVDRTGLFGCAAVILSRDEQPEVSVDIAADGSFSTTLPYSVPAQEVWFWLGDHFYGTLIVREAVTISLDYAQLAKTKNNQWAHPGVTFSGPDAALCTARGKQIAAAQAKNLTLHEVILDRDKNAQEKQQNLDTIYTALKAVDDTILSGFPEDVAALLINETTTNYLAISNVLYWKEEMSAPLLERYLQHEPMAISNATRDFYSYFAAGVTSRAGRVLKERLEVSLLEANLHPKTMDYLLKKLDKDYPPARADIYKLYLEYEDPTYNKRVLEKTLPTVRTPWVKQILEARYEKQQVAWAAMQATLAKKAVVIDPKDLGEPAASFDFDASLYTTPAGQKGEDLLQMIRGAFPGKALYLDLWAVWCGPCVQELPFSAKLHAKAHDLPLEFLYLCTEAGGDQEKWENLIAQHKVPGTHLFIPKDTHAELMKIFSGRGFPTYLLLLPDGTVVKDIERPSTLDREKLAVRLKK